MNKGRHAFRIGDYEEAERQHLTAVELARESGSASEYGEALGDLGGVYLYTARYDESRRVCMMALTILRDTTGIGKPRQKCWRIEPKHCVSN
jgi:tetratricopeptide (TPR) repeat protein